MDCFRVVMVGVEGDETEMGVFAGIVKEAYVRVVVGVEIKLVAEETLKDDAVVVEVVLVIMGAGLASVMVDVVAAELAVMVDSESDTGAADGVVDDDIGGDATCDAGGEVELIVDDLVVPWVCDVEVGRLVTGVDDADEMGKGVT